jgi:hypothetical protein
MRRLVMVLSVVLILSSAGLATYALAIKEERIPRHLWGVGCDLPPGPPECQVMQKGFLDDHDLYGGRGP